MKMILLSQNSVELPTIRSGIGFSGSLHRPTPWELAEALLAAYLFFFRGAPLLHPGFSTQGPGRVTLAFPLHVVGTVPRSGVSESQ